MRFYGLCQASQVEGGIAMKADRQQRRKEIKAVRLDIFHSIFFLLLFIQDELVYVCVSVGERHRETIFTYRAPPPRRDGALFFLVNVN